MGYRKFDSSTFDDLKAQHNIMALIGNGFDIQILKALDFDKTTSYIDFYEWLQEKNTISSENLIFSNMKEEKQRGHELWSNFELGLLNLCIQRRTPENELYRDLIEIQSLFATYLNEIITATTLSSIGEVSSKNKLAVNTMGRFVADLDYEDYSRFRFYRETNHYHLYNWLFVNFNYTTIFDNYIHLDKEQFEPHPYKYADRNFTFYPYDNKYKLRYSTTKWSSYLLTEIIHPHGMQSVPKSMIFGFDSNQGYQDSYTFAKPYWGQNNKKYHHLFPDTRLFIIYGHSLGETDKWWWQNIIQALLNTDAELIIYYYTPQDKTHLHKTDIKNEFIDAACLEFSDEQKETLENKIFIVTFSETTEKVAFAFKPDS